MNSTCMVLVVVSIQGLEGCENGFDGAMSGNAGILEAHLLREVVVH